jgi:hypothetical protein
MIDFRAAVGHPSPVTRQILQDMQLASAYRQWHAACKPARVPLGQEAT